MRIALNLLGYRPGSGGVETYLLNLLRTLQDVDRRNEYQVLCDPAAADSLKIERTNFTLRPQTIEKPSLNWFFRGVVKRLSDFDLLTWQLKGLNVDMVHHPLTTLNPFGLPFPAVLTFHDLQHEFFPDLFSEKELSRRRKEYPASLNQAQSVIAISHHVKACLVDCYAVAPEKIHVVYHGYSEKFRRIGSGTQKAVIRQKYFLDRPFMIYPASTWAHKNHLRLLKVIHVLRQRGLFDGELLLTGGAMDYHGKVLSEINNLQLNGTVRWLGYVPDADLPYLYNMARFLVFPSLFEGFGLPVIEAMACGCPVAIANVTALPEVAGSAAILFEPESIDDMVETLGRCWQDDSQGQAMVEAGLQRSALFSWEKTAQETINVYHQTLLGAVEHVD